MQEGLVHHDVNVAIRDVILLQSILTRELL